MKQLKPYLYSLFLFFGFQMHAQVAVKAGLENLFKDTTQRIILYEELDAFNLLDSIYEQHEYNLVFNHGMQAMYLKYLKETADWGFNPEHYNYALLDSLYRSRDPLLKAHLDLYFCQSYLDLYEDILNGILKSEKKRGDKIHFKLETFDAYNVLKQLIDLPSITYLKLAEPNEASYIATKNLLSQYLNQLEAFDQSQIIFSDTLRIGDQDSVVSQLRQRLYLLGDLKIEHRLRSNIFDKDVAQALSDFQARNLLPINGILDRKTSDLLNRDLKSIIAELQINLERWRWLPFNLGSYYAFANLPAFEMSLIKEDSLLIRQRMVCGKVSRSTPAFMATMSYIDINPTWTVPPTILQQDILPAARRNSGYLSNKNIKVLDITTGTYVSSASINWANSSNYRFVQGPGLSNSLGLVKFIFPNNYYIFFHDTPHKEHFPLAARAFSSGCIRLAQPLEFAEIVLKYNQESLSRAEIDSIVGTQKTTRILLEEQPEVYIYYLTQEFKEGKLFQYPDVYGYNKALRLNFDIETKD